MAAIITASMSETDRATEGTVGVWLNIGSLLLARLHRKLMIVFFKHLRVQWVKFWVICWVAALLSSNGKGSWRPSAPKRWDGRGRMEQSGFNSPPAFSFFFSSSHSPEQNGSALAFITKVRPQHVFMSGFLQSVQGCKELEPDSWGR